MKVDLDGLDIKARMQEIFNKAYLGVVGQGGLAITPHGDCCYTFEGKHCAAGWLLTEEQQQRVIDLDLNFKVFGHVNREFNVVPSKLEPFVCLIQMAHDACGGVDGFIDRMRKLAYKNNLTVPELPA